MQPLTWPCPKPGGQIAEEYALAFDRKRTSRLLIVPALFEESNRLRRFTVEVMRRLDASGMDCFLPDFPGMNESRQALDVQSCDDWNDAMAAAAEHFGATYTLGIRGGCLFSPGSIPGWHYAPAKGPNILRQMLRARILASRESGREENREDLTALALREGIELAGYCLSADFIHQFSKLEARSNDQITEIGQDMVGGSGLWLRAEPGESREQADALAAVIAMGCLA